MNRVVRALMSAGCVLLLVLTGAALSHRERVMQLAHGWQERSDGREIADKLLSSRDMLEYIAEHPEEVSLASWTVGAESQGIYLNADIKRPVASTQKLLVLAEYAARIETGRWSAAEVVPVEEWERYWLNGTDGGAHAAALHQANADGRVSRGSVRLRDIADAMIRYSDNAAHDLLLDRITQPSAAALPEQLGLTAEDAPLPLAGLFLTWQTPNQPAAELLARYRAYGPQRYTAETWRLSARLRDDAQFRAAQAEQSDLGGFRLSLREQEQLAAALGAHGTARGYARLMAQVVTEELPGSKLMREQLEWPMASGQVRADFDALGSKRGSLPGVVAAAHYAVAKGAEAPRVLALFMNGLPPAVWLHMSRTVVQQRFELELLQDDGFFAEARQRLTGAGSAPQAEAEDTRHASSL
jgi:D-alanyl-D-alanine carboxypeptidase